MNAPALALVAALALALSAPARAQDAPADPPLVVGRIASLRGTVSFHLRDAEQWQRATLNLPLSDGSALWTGPGSQAAIGVSGNRITLAPATEFDLDGLDERRLAATQPQGETYLRVVRLQPGETITVRTPRGIAAFAGAGRYAVVSGDTEHPTTITVLEGGATVTGLPAAVEVGANQTLAITGDGAAQPFTPTLGAAAPDAFVRDTLAAERPPTRRATIPAPVLLMTGADALEEYGDWSQSAEYGPVWYPPVAAGYVPYRDGHWAYVEPWGWTWVDAAPWGFAPTHYGRWTQIGGRWAWLPGRDWAPDRPPAYAPALVGFIAGAAAGSVVAWAPLGPRDPYRPAYGASPRYLEALNRPAGADLGRTSVTVVNRQAITVVPTQVVTNSANVAASSRGHRLAGFDPSGPVQFRPAVTPGAATLGATRAVLQGRPAASAPAAAGAVPPAAPGLPGLRATTGLRPELPRARGGVVAPAALPALRPQGAAPTPAAEPAPGAIAPRPAARPGAAGFTPAETPRGHEPPFAAPPPRPERPSPEAAPQYRPAPRPGAIARPEPPHAPTIAAPARPEPPPHVQPPRVRVQPPQARFQPPPVRVQPQQPRPPQQARPEAPHHGGDPREQRHP